MLVKAGVAVGLGVCCDAPSEGDHGGEGSEGCGDAGQSTGDLMFFGWVTRHTNAPIILTSKDKDLWKCEGKGSLFDRKGFY